MLWSSPDSDYVYKISYLRALSASFIFSFSMTSTFLKKLFLYSKHIKNPLFYIFWDIWRLAVNYIHFSVP